MDQTNDMKGLISHLVARDYRRAGDYRQGLGITDRGWVLYLKSINGFRDVM